MMTGRQTERRGDRAQTERQGDSASNRKRDRASDRWTLMIMLLPIPLSQNFLSCVIRHKIYDAQYINLAREKKECQIQNVIDREMIGGRGKREGGGGGDTHTGYKN